MWSFTFIAIGFLCLYYAYEAFYTLNSMPAVVILVAVGLFLIMFAFYIARNAHQHNRSEKMDVFDVVELLFECLGLMMHFLSYPLRMMLDFLRS